MRRAFLLLCLSACQAPQEPPPKLVDGYYQLCAEVQGYSTETLELKGGRYRYWFTSDVMRDDEPVYPLLGLYRVDGNQLILDSPVIYKPRRTIAILNGVNVLWRDDGLKYWNAEKRLHAYALLIHNPEPFEQGQFPDPPSLERVSTAESKALEKKLYEERFNDQPEPLRKLLRANTRQDDELAEFTTFIKEARAKLDPALIRQLVELLGYGSLGVTANGILEDLYLPTWIMKEPPPFASRKADRDAAIGILIDAFAAAKDRQALESVLMVYLRASNVRRMELQVPSGGVRISLEVREGAAGGGFNELPDSPNRPRDSRWTDKMGVILPACQDWARAQLKK